MNILFKNIRIVEPNEAIDMYGDIWIKDGIIDSIGDNINAVGADIIDGTGMVVAPGFIDIHSHFREPGQTDKENLDTGCAAAANGGFTEVVVMPNTTPAIDNVMVVNYIKERSKGNLVDVHISAALTKDRKGEELVDYVGLMSSGVEMFTDDGSCVGNAEVMKRIIEYNRGHNVLLSQHCEEHSITAGFGMNYGALSVALGLKGYPNIAEELIIARDIMLCAALGHKRYHVQHISTAGGVDIVRNVKAKYPELRVSAEVTPHHLFFTDAMLADYDANYKMNPPLRSEKDRYALIAGLIDGTLDCIATDHAPHSAEDCEKEFENVPNGIIGLESAVGASGSIMLAQVSLNEFVSYFTTKPRAIMGHKQIQIKSGEKANLTIFSPTKEWVYSSQGSLSKAKNTPFDCVRLICKPEYVFNNGQCFVSLLT